MTYRLVDRFRNLFDGKQYRHRDSSLGDSVALCVIEDLYDLGLSPRLNSRIDNATRVLNIQNRTHGVAARRGDGTFGELIPNEVPERVSGYAVARGPIATVEIGTEVKILAKAMIKQIDRVIGDLSKQVGAFRTAGGNPVCIGIVGINQADRYTSYEGERPWPTDGRKYKHPSQEAAAAESRLLARVAAEFDEFLVLRFKAWNDLPFRFEWVDERRTVLDYGALLTRTTRKYEARF